MRSQTLKEPRSDKEMIEGVREQMLEAIRVRLRADVPVGVYLSGGIDSSVIAGMVTHLVKEQGERMGNDKETERVSCFSIAFDEDSGFDESAIANRTADHLGVKYYKKHMNEAELAARFEDATWYCEHHNPDLNYVGKYALSEVPQELGFKVVLTGEGADEQFGGYPMYLPDYLREPDASYPSNPLPEDVRKVQCIKTDEEASAYYKSVGADGANRGPSIPRRMLNDITTVSSMAAFSAETLFADWTREYGACDPQLTIVNSVDGLVRDEMMEKWHPLHTALYVWQKGHLSNIFLSCLGDRTEMAHSIEARTPFLDHHLTEYVNGLPPSVKIRWNAEEKRFVEKWILREASRPFITDELYKRKKHVSDAYSVVFKHLSQTDHGSHIPPRRRIQRTVLCRSCSPACSPETEWNNLASYRGRRSMALLIRLSERKTQTPCALHSLSLSGSSLVNVSRSRKRVRSWWDVPEPGRGGRSRSG